MTAALATDDPEALRCHLGIRAIGLMLRCYWHAVGSGALVIDDRTETLETLHTAWQMLPRLEALFPDPALADPAQADPVTIILHGTEAVAVPADDSIPF